MAGFGETLRQARAHKGVTLREAEQATRINRHHLAALEEENFDALPPLIYQRGIVRNYASWLGLDPSKMLTLFEETHGITATGASKGVAPPPIDMPSHWAPNFAIIAFAAVLSAIIFAWGYSIWVTPSDDDAEATVVTTQTTPNVQADEMTTEIPDAPAPPTVPATEAPQPTATTEDTATVSGRQDESATTEGETESDSANEYTTGLAVEAQGDIEVTVSVDGEVVYDDVLAAGNVTDEYVGSLFQVTTSASEDTVFINSCGDKTEMSNAEGEQSFEFAANENSCAPRQ